MAIDDRGQPEVEGAITLRTVEGIRREGKGSESKAIMGIGENGGSIAVWEKDAEPRTLVGSDKRGGKVIVLGKEGKAKTVVGVNEYGNGAVSTWDRNGNRLK